MGAFLQIKKFVRKADSPLLAGRCKKPPSVVK